MNVLIIGGTRFVGRHITEALLARGHTVTLFNRGQTNADAFPEVQQIHGDRKSDLQKLGQQTWDAVVDTCGYTPDVVETSARYFAERTKHYTFVSTISVYDAKAAPAGGIDEDSPLDVLPPDADRTTMTMETYGALKAVCENVVRETFGERAAIVRPGLVAGPYDPTDRFTYWPVRYDAGGTLLAPAPQTHPIQYIDARDLAAFTVQLLERAGSGTYNAVTDPGRLSFGDLFQACAAASGAETDVAWLDPAWLLEQGVTPWGDLPLWIPAGHEAEPIVHASNARALAAGLRPRPIADTVRDTLAWAKEAGKRLGSLGAGLSPDREAQLLQAYPERLTTGLK